MLDKKHLSIGAGGRYSHILDGHDIHRKMLDSKGYGIFKPAVGEVVIDTLRPIREEAERLIKDKAYLDDIYRQGAERASYIANKTLRKVYKKVGFYQI